MRKSKLNPEQQQKVEYLLYLSDDLRCAYYLKEQFYEILDCNDNIKAKKLLSEWILSAQNSGLPDYSQCPSTLQNWAKSILDTFDYPYIATMDMTVSEVVAVPSFGSISVTVSACICTPQTGHTFTSCSKSAPQLLHFIFPVV